jgi:hypothetical protein
LAFDGEKGRLWAVCGRCARWNLAPIEERWEAIEEAERLFRDTRTRVQSENIGLAKLRDGTRLVRVGQALAGELAAWRYGETLARRQSRAVVYGGIASAVGAGLYVAGLGLLFAGGLMVGPCLYPGYQYLRLRVRELRPVGVAEAEIGGARQQVQLRGVDADGAWLSQPNDGQGIALNFPRAVQVPEPRGSAYPRKVPLVLRGDAALPVLGRVMVHVNSRGGSARGVQAALKRMQAVGSPGEFVQEVARRRLLLTGGATKQPRANLGFDSMFDPEPDERPSEPGIALALEMALHEETERRALDGELAMLEAMWRDAEEIASIADRLPGLPAPEPPRLDPAR